MRTESIKWVSRKYMEWLRRFPCTFCGKPLEQDGLTWELHHANHKRNSSAFYTRICRVCHTTLSLNESRFNESHDMNREKWYKHCLEELSEYVESLGVDSTMICIAALAKVAEENE